nr:hypothetical protein [Asgard group archaeon]
MSSGKNKVVKEVYIVPHTHWDREWYLPFQAFRFKLVKLIDQLLENMKKLDYYFTLDGQSIVLEDYLEIRPEKKSELVELIRKGKIAIGPWYILPDEWLVGQESLLRNLEISFDLAREFDIPVMQVGYLPDQFGHTKAIPQILSNLTKFKAMVAWRGIGPEITSIPFIWKSHPEAKSMILGNYLPFGYGNAAGLPNDDSLTESIEKRIEELEPYTTIPNYLLMNGTDHHFPQFFILDWIANQKLKGLKIKLSLLEEYIDSLQKKISELNYSPPIYSGEFRSSARAPLLQDTYSARMWIKQWDAKIEDLLIHYAEPISSILFANSIKDYPTSELVLAWKWLLKNQPHDSICGCSIDQVHEEMKSRYYWAESIANTILEETKEIIEEKSQKDDGSYCAVFNPTNSKEILQEITFTVPAKTPILAVETLDGIECHTQVESASEDIVFDNNFKPMMLKAGLKMLPGRKLMDIYLNEVHLSDGEDPRLCEILLMFGKKQIGELDITALKADMVKIIESKKYNKFHVKATLGTKQTYSSMVPLNPWSLTKVKLKSKIKDTIISNFETTKNKVRTQFYEISFNNDGTFDLHDKKTNMIFPRLHQFESWGDRGDEYTFGRLGPIKTKLKRITRKVLSDGPNYSEIQQDSLLETFAEIDLTREKRIGKTLIPISTIFKFYRDIPRIDIKS